MFLKCRQECVPLFSDVFKNFERQVVNSVNCNDQMLKKRNVYHVLFYLSFTFSQYLVFTQLIFIEVCTCRIIFISCEKIAILRCSFCIFWHVNRFNTSRPLSIIANVSYEGYTCMHRIVFQWFRYYVILS